MRSSLTYNTSTRHERHAFNTSVTLATRVRHKWDTSDTSATRVLLERHECDTSATRTNFDFDNDTGKNMFSHPYIYCMASERLQGEKRFHSESAFTCNRDEIWSRDETRPGMKKILFTREFHPQLKRDEFHPGMKFNLKENLPLSMKTYNKIYNWYVKTSYDYFFRKVTLFIIFVSLLMHFRSSRPGRCSV